MIRILLADDHPIIVSGVEALLRNSQYELVGTFGDGEAVIAALPDVAPDIVVLDLRMPGCSGLEVLRRMRAANDDRPVILLTAEIGMADTDEAVRLGANGIVLKETAAESLLSCLDAVSRGEPWFDEKLQDRLGLTADGLAVASPFSVLSPREREVADLVAKGLRNRDIAAALGISEGTVKVHLCRVYERLGISSRTELAILARDHPRS
jgi:two-component system nitrate/nitrite response regulator NarL